MRHTGSTDLPLAPEGIAQAGAIAGALSGRKFDVVLVSPLMRAQQTCRIAGLGAPAQLRDNLREWDYGDYEGLTTPEIRMERPGWDLWRDGCPGGESAADVGRRADAIVAELRLMVGEQRAAVFAHGHLLRVLAARWVDLEPERGSVFGLDTATFSTLGQERDNPVIWGWNDSAHLRALRL